MKGVCVNSTKLALVQSIQITPELRLHQSWTSIPARERRIPGNGVRNWWRYAREACRPQCVRIHCTLLYQLVTTRTLAEPRTVPLALVKSTKTSLLGLLAMAAVAVTKTEKVGVAPAANGAMVTVGPGAAMH
jgi:hypothetical protein